MSIKVIAQPFQKEIKVTMIIHTINMGQKIKKYINSGESLLDMQRKIERIFFNLRKNT